MGKQVRYSSEVRDRAVRMAFEHQNEHGSEWETIRGIASKIGCTNETLRRWVRQAQINITIWAQPFGSGFPLQCLALAACSRLIANRRGSRRHFRCNPLRLKSIGNLLCKAEPQDSKIRIQRPCFTPFDRRSEMESQFTPLRSPHRQIIHNSQLNDALPEEAPAILCRACLKSIFDSEYQYNESKLHYK